MSDKLHKLRDAIDQIDAEILQLITYRMTLSDEVIAAKMVKPRLAGPRSGTGSAVGDGNDMHRRIAGIWRQIMAASLTRQNKDLHLPCIRPHCQRRSGIWGAR